MRILAVVSKECLNFDEVNLLKTTSFNATVEIMERSSSSEEALKDISGARCLAS